MAYTMFCDKCRKVLKVDENLISPFAVVEVSVPSQKRTRKLRYCEDCANEVIEEADANRQRIAEEVSHVAED